MVLSRAISILVVFASVAQFGSAQGCLSATAAGPVFQTALIDAQSGKFTFEADVTPQASGASTSAGVSLAASRVGDFTDMAATVRFFNGFVDMRSGSTYRSDASVPFTAGQTYHVRMVVDVAQHVYSAYVRRIPAVQESTVGQNYLFRDGQQTMTRLALWAAFADVGSAVVCNASAYPSYKPIRSLRFDGIKDFVEAPDRDAFSVPTTGALTVAVSIRLDTLAFPKIEGSGYVDFLGKGEGYGTAGQQEWYFRIYSQGNTENRGNRISFYVFNPQGGLGNGSYFQDAVTPGAWIDLVAVVDAHSTYLYKNGVLRDCDNYNSGGPSTCNPPFIAVVPANGTSPLRIGTVDLSSFFEGSIKNVRVWNRALASSEVSGLRAGTVPSAGLVAQYLLNADTVPGGQGLSATVYGARWIP